MPKFEYTFDIEETIIKRCEIEVEAATLEAAMNAVENLGPWEWDVKYGKELWYESEEIMDNNARNPDNWNQLDAH